MNSYNPRAFREDFRRLNAEESRRPEPMQATARTLSSSALFAGTREIGIEHHGALYRLKITRQGKLILNK
jgi:hemin uptake protein HemP